MANIIDLSGGRCLQFSGSEAFYRKMDIPSGSSDIRFGMMISTPASASVGNTVAQSIFPTTVIFERLAFAFMSETGSIPTGTSVKYFGITNVVSPTEDQSLVRDVSVNGNYVIGSNNGRLSFQNLILNPGYETYTDHYNNGGNLLALNSLPVLNVPALNVFRIYKTNTRDIGYVIYTKRNNSTNPTTNEEILKDGLTNTTNLTETNQRGVIRYVDVASRDAAFDNLNTIFFGWPFYNVPINIHCIGYRAI